MKRGSLAAVLILLLAVCFGLNIQERLSSSFDVLLPESESKQTLLLYQKSVRSQHVVLAAKNEEMAQMLEKIEHLSGYEKLTSKESLDFAEKYRFYLAKMPETLPNEEQIKEKLKSLKQELLEGFTLTIDAHDPLGLFENRKISASIPSIDGYDTSVVFKLNITPDKYEEYYHELFDIINDKDAFIFSPFFYHVENAALFSSQVKFILSLSALVLALLYLYWLRQGALLVCVVLTLLSAAAFSQIAAALIWSEISLYSLIFSAAVSAISIDYMFHYYILGLYKKPSFSKSVFLGFFTTFAAFVALGFVNFTLISQIALTSAAALLFAYVSFAFVYPHLGFGEDKSAVFDFDGKPLLNPLFVVIASLVIIVISPLWISFDYDVKALDIKNRSLDAKAAMINSADQSAVLLKANSLDELIQEAKNLQKNGAFFGAASLLGADEHKQKFSKIRELDFGLLRKNVNAIAPTLGFKSGFFDKAYADELLYATTPIYTEEFLSAAQIVRSKDNVFYASGFGNLTQSDDITAVNSVRLFEKELLRVRGELVFAGVFIVVLIIFTTLFAARKSALKALSFIFAPLAFCLCIFIFTKMTVLHIFMLIVVAAMSVDYGIYSVSGGGKRVKRAICYSLLSTVAGFGVLAFSSIASMRAIGITALCACFMITILLYFMRTKDEADT